MSKLTTLLLLTTTLFSASPLQAQITPDATLGQENSQIINNTQIKGLPGELITGGAIRGTNLFHSFSQFNVGELQRVYFENPAAINNILTRVTGNNPSEILGTLGVDGTANLFLINPNGVFFGENARLDIAGSFFVSTADSLLLENGREFSATNPDAPPLLTVNIRPGLQYGNNVPRAEIVNRGKLLVGQDLTLVGRNLDLTGEVQGGGDVNLVATNEVKIRDSVTNPFVAAAGGELLVQGDEKVDIFALNHPDSGLFAGGDLTLRSGNAVGGDAHYWSGGNFRVEKLDGSLGDLFSPDDPIIITSGDVILGDYQGASLHILAGGSVALGDVLIDNLETGNNSINPGNTNNINATTTYSDLANFNLSDGTAVPTINGNARPTLDIRAGIDWNALGGIPTPDNSVIDGNSFFTANPPPRFSTPLANANITTGEIVTAFGFAGSDGGRVVLTNQFFPNSLPGGIAVNGVIDTREVQGGGSIQIDSRGDTTLQGGINASALDQNIGGGLPLNTYGGNGGDVTILGTGTLTTNAEILARGLLGGNVRVHSDAPLVLSQGIFNESYTDTSTLKGGDINLSSGGSFTLQNGAELSARTAGTTAIIGTATAGNISVDAQEINIENTSGIYANSDIADMNSLGSNGDSGQITLTAEQGISLNRGFIFVNTNGDGNAGVIDMQAKTLQLENGSFVSAFSQGTGTGGTITVNASESATLIGNDFNPVNNANFSGIFLGATSTGNAGNLTVNTKQLTLQEGARIFASTSGQGQAGNVVINASEFVKVVGTTPNGQVRSGLSSDTFGGGNAGNFVINTSQLLVEDGGEVSASTVSDGQGGTLVVNASDLVKVSGVANSGQASRLVFASSGSGNAQGIEINTKLLNIENGGQVNLSGNNSGNAGDILVNAESVNMTNGARLTTETINANGGNIQLFVDKSVILRQDSDILTNANGTGSGGNMTLRVGDFIVAILAEDSDIIASSLQGQGGNITATAKGIFGFRLFEKVNTSESDFTASSELGIDGTVEINVNDNLRLNPLDDRFLDEGLPEGCAVGSNGEKNSVFIDIGRAGLPSNPSDPLSSSIDSLNTSVTSLSDTQQSHSDQSIQEVQGWFELPDGEIILTSQAFASCLLRND